MTTNQKAEGLRPQHPALPRFHYPLDEDLPRQALSQRVLLAAFVLDGDDAIECPDLLDGKDAPRHEATLPEVAQDRNVSSLTLTMRTRCPASASLKGLNFSGARVPSAAGMGPPCGSRSGWPKSSDRHSVNLSETACSILSASSWTSCHEYARYSIRNVSIRRCRRTSLNASASPRLVNDAPR